MKVTCEKRGLQMAYETAPNRFAQARETIERELDVIAALFIKRGLEHPRADGQGGRAMSEERFYTIRPRRRPVADSDGNEWPSVRDAALAVSGAVSAESCISHACRTGGTTGVTNVMFYIRAERLHIVTARHLRKARKTIRELRGSVERLQRLCDEKNALIYAYRGSIGNVSPSTPVPEHYLGDGYVTCDRAIESASAQRCIVSRTPLNYWYWATAFKYVWRMWSKENPVADGRKAIDCIRKALGEVEG